MKRALVLRRCIPGAVLMCAFAMGSAASAASFNDVTAEWVALGGSAPARTVVLLEGKSQPYVQIMPRVAFRLDRDVLSSNGELLIPGGTLLTSARERADTRCELKRRKGKQSFICLIDSNGDGEFESAARMIVPNGEIFISKASVSRNYVPLVSPAAMTEVDPTNADDRFTVELFFSNRAELAGRNDVQVCIIRSDVKSIWGSSTDMRICQKREFDLKDSAYPFSASLYGGSFQFVSREKNWINLELHPPISDYAF